MKYQCLLFLFFMGAYTLSGQSCCSGGVPVSSNLGLPAGKKGVLQGSLNYDLNVLSTLQSGRERLDDDSRTRTTHTVFLELGYSWTKRLSTDLFLPLIRQERNINQLGGLNDFDATSGVGDVVFLLKYQVINPEKEKGTWQIGVGPKIPLGATNHQDDIGILLSADLQPGSGSWDILFWSQFAQSTLFRPSLSVIGTATYVMKQENPSFSNGETYEFGDELLLGIGGSDRLLIGKQLIDPSLMLRYRTTNPDFRNRNQLPSTGGEWLFLGPGLSWWIKDKLSLNLNADIPIFANLSGTQTTPSYRFTVGVFWKNK